MVRPTVSGCDETPASAMRRGVRRASRNPAGGAVRGAGADARRPTASSGRGRPAGSRATGFSSRRSSPSASAKAASRHSAAKNAARSSSVVSAWVSRRAPRQMRPRRWSANSSRARSGVTTSTGHRHGGASSARAFAWSPPKPQSTIQPASVRVSDTKASDGRSLVRWIATRSQTSPPSQAWDAAVTRSRITAASCATRSASKARNFTHPSSDLCQSPSPNPLSTIASPGTKGRVASPSIPCRGGISPARARRA